MVIGGALRAPAPSARCADALRARWPSPITSRAVGNTAAAAEVPKMVSLGAAAALLVLVLLPLASAQECTEPNQPCTDADAGPGEGCGDLADECTCSEELLCLLPPSSGWIPQWVLGVVLYSFGAMMINLGSNIVKYGHTAREKALEAGDKPGEEKATKTKVRFGSLSAPWALSLFAH